MKRWRLIGSRSVRRGRWLFFKSPTPAPAVCWPREGPALRRLRWDQWARAVGPLSARHRGAWGQCSRRGQRGAAFDGQPQDFGAEGRIITRPFRGRCFFYEFGKLPPNSLLVYSTNSLCLRSINSLSWGYSYMSYEPAKLDSRRQLRPRSKRC